MGGWQQRAEQREIRIQQLESALNQLRIMLTDALDTGEYSAVDELEIIEKVLGVRNEYI